ncbi:cystathionine gamma-lyase [Pseudonocardia sp. TRM90224]|uniref:cystathionine gamma-lyase n=1 Tax=Pseudonocardia sp. TRM90224 TaxID=2812678 RepID=UPI001E5C8CBC|nr:cystathionine gamma-lyase [Pseudonocardia sp. TRM90224]
MHPDPSRAGDGTRCVHGGHVAAALGAPLHPGPVLSSTFELGVPGDPAPADFYGRADNPTWRALEAAIGALDGGRCVAFASGMAAIGAVLRLGATGGALVVPADGYYLARSLAHAELAPLGVEVREVPTNGDWAAAMDGAGLVLLETPSNPGLDVVDIAAVAALAHAAGALLAVDNTTATPLGQVPLDLGADLTVASDTKALAGHGDVVLGHVTARDPALLARLREARSRGGAVPGPMEAWLAHRGLATLDLRLARQAENARAVAELALAHPAASDVRWPGLAGDPAHAVAAAQMRRWNGVLRFTLASEQAVAAFLKTSNLVGSATSFGGPRSTVDRRERWGDAVDPALLRFSAGCEDTADLVADVRAALDAAAGA